MKVLSWFWIVSVLPAAAGNQVLLRNLAAADGAANVLAADNAGHLFVTSSVLAGSDFVARIVKLDLDGARLASLDLPQATGIESAVTDTQGNLIVAGSDHSLQGIILKVDSQLHGVLFSKVLPGSIHAIALDSSGNIYATGSTSSAAFPVTQGAYQTKPPSGGAFGSRSYAFLSEISSAGDRVVYSTFFGGDSTNCQGGSSCIGVFASTIGTAIAVDRSGAVVIGGSTSAIDLPTTTGALASTCNCGAQSGLRWSAGFVARFQPSSSQQLQSSTYLNANPNLGSPVSVTVKSLDLDSAGDVILGGSAPEGLPTTAGVIQPAPVSAPGGPASGGFVLKLNSAGTAVIWGTYFGDTPSSHVQTLRVDAKGQIVFTGVTIDASQVAQPAFSPPSLTRSYVARLSADGATLIDFYGGPNALVGQDLAITSTGGFASVGAALWIETSSPGPSLLSVVNAASQEYAGKIAAVELVTLYGVDIGPQSPTAGQIQAGAFTSILGGTQVFFDGIAAPLLYASSGQINAVVPRNIGPSPRVRVVTSSGTIDGPTIQRASFAPGVFNDSRTGMAAALNQDGSINSPENPARPGSIVSVFATGAGTVQFIPDGAIVPREISLLQAGVWVVNEQSLEVEYAGDAPGLVAGVMQINFRVPSTLRIPQNVLPFSVVAGGVSSASSLIAVMP
jgi:uncharacterized protein (TIGR03437 family)